MNLKIYKSNTTYKFNKSYTAYFVLFVLLFSFFIAPAKPARAAALSRPPTNLGLVGYWPMDEGAGTTINDFSGLNKQLTLYGTTKPVWVNGRHNKAMKFDGIDNYVSGNEPYSLKGGNSWTISGWIKANAVNGSDKVAIGKLGWHGGIIWVNNNMSFLVSSVTNMWGCIQIHYTPELNKWYHYTATYDSATKESKYFVNGNLVGTVTACSNMTNYSDTLYIGGSGGGGYASNITTDDVRIYNRVLPAAEVAKLYSSGQTTLKKVSEQGLVGYWALNDGAGSIAGDSSGQNNHGTITGATWTNGKRGGALSFNGISDGVDVGNASSLTNLTADVTLSAWAKPNSLESYYEKNIIISGRRTETAQPYTLTISPTQIAMTFQTDNVGNGFAGWTSKAVSVTNNLGEWAYFSVVRNGLNVIFYKNGQQVGVPQTFLASTIYSGNGALIGRGFYGGGWYFNGLIDDVRIYNRALSATEIQSLYKQNETMANAPQNDKLTNGLVGLWSFNGKDVSGSTAYDRSGQGRNGTIVGSAPLTAGKVGQGISFNNSGQYVQSGSVFSEFGTSNQAYTIAGWMKINNGVSSGNVVFMGDSWCLPPVNITSGKLRATSWNNGQVDSLGTTTLSPNIWYQFATTWDASNGLRIFVNGELENSTVMANFTAAGSARVFRAGYSPGSCAGDTGALNGAVDEVRIYNRALSASEVKQLYLMGK